MPKPPHPPRPTNPPTSSQPRQALRLHRDDSDGTNRTNGAENVRDQSYKFPAAVGVTRGKSGGTGVGRRLVAATVAEAPVERTFEGSPCAVLNGGDDPDCLGRIVSSSQLVKEIESTLDRMQSRLSRFRTDMDRAFQFPVAYDRDLPPAA